MSVPSIASEGLAPVDSALEPSWVRNGSTQVQQDYEVAQGFEEVLMQQLSTAMTSSGTGSEEEGGEDEGGQSGFSSLLPQALAQGVSAGGGLGLAAQLTRDMLGPSAGATSGSDTKAQHTSTSAADTSKIESSGGTAA